jgi:hypothetical protein
MFEWFKRRADRVILPDGRIGVIDHMKPDGKLGVRPIHPLTGAFYPNPSRHWTDAQRAKIPEELAISAHDIRIASTGLKPRLLKVRF